MIEKVCLLCKCVFEYDGGQRGQSTRRFCDKVCRNKHNGIKNRGKRYYSKANDERQEENAQWSEGKVECLICKNNKKENRYFNRVGSHVFYYHHVTAREYKEMFGFDTIKGILSPELRKVYQDNNFANKKVVVDINLVEKGVGTRFKKSHKGGKYKRSEETLTRLKKMGGSNKRPRKT